MSFGGRGLDFHEFEERTFPHGETRLPEFVGERGYASYRELGIEKVLFVEGVSEIKTIQQFLEKPRKDRRIVLIHMGGSDLINRKMAE